ncbi:MAG TPA: NAD(P)/FAD-dependent oxidoreductase [Anaerolineales bacterium]|jgi:thioredoxin reductase|nr:NAD(P)/FAD-dependent oxidoreductase [Anaerolineales bacterium]
MYDLIVVGGGPAGLTATVYAIRKRLNVLMISKDLGGKTNYRLALPWIEDYQVIRGLEVVNKFRSELEYLKFARHMEPVDGIEKEGDIFNVTTQGGGDLQAKSLIIATGTKQQRLNVPGEKQFIMRGLCYSALSYAPLFIDRKTVVVGEGDLALRSAAELATVAKHVHLIGLSGAALSSDLGVKLAAAPNVTILEDYSVTEVLGDGFASQLKVKSPGGEEQTIEAEGTFIEMNLIPNSQMVESLVELDDQGRIIVDCYARTNIPGVFAAGDVTNSYAEQVLVAVGDGAKASLSAYDYLLPRL